MQILITGAAGFLGHNLSRELRKRHPEATIHGIDNLWTGRIRRDQVVDRMFIGYVEDSDAPGIYDYVYHMASPASPIKYQSAPLHTIRANVDGLWRCLRQWLMPNGTIFFASSSEVYGDPLVSPQPESYKGSVSTTGIRACYDESKRLCETILMDWSRLQVQQQVRIIRLFNVYGPGTLPDDGRCMSNFIWDAMCGMPVTIYGDGLQTRCFTYVDNVVRGIVDFVESSSTATGPMNLGSDIETSVRDIAVAVCSEVAKWHARCGHKFQLLAPDYLPPVADDPRQRLPDLTMAREQIGWNPRKLIQPWGDSGGIARTVSYFEREFWREDLYHQPGSREEPAHADGPAGSAPGDHRDLGPESRAGAVREVLD